jgi:hypothetical protein
LESQNPKRETAKRAAIRVSEWLEEARFAVSRISRRQLKSPARQEAPAKRDLRAKTASLVRPHVVVAAVRDVHIAMGVQAPAGRPVIRVGHNDRTAMAMPVMTVMVAIVGVVAVSVTVVAVMAMVAMAMAAVAKVDVGASDVHVNTEGVICAGCAGGGGQGNNGQGACETDE